MKFQIPSFLVFLILITSIKFTLAQKKEDVIYLRDGSIIRGIIQKNCTHNKISILNHAGDTWVFDTNKVDSVLNEKPFEYKALMFNQNGFEFNINGVFLFRTTENAIGKSVIPGINLLYGYKFNPYFSSGIGVGLEFYDQMEIPFFAELRLRWLNRTFSPLTLFKAGYTVPAENKSDDWEYKYKSHGGYTYTIGLGIDRILDNNTSFIISFSYHHQKLDYSLTPLNEWLQERERSEIFSRFQLTLGYCFK